MMNQTSDFRKPNVQIGRDEVGKRKEFALNGGDCIVCHQLVSAGGNHDWVVHHPFRMILTDTLGNGMGDVLVAYHSYFDGFGLKILHDRFYLLANHIGGDRMDTLYTERILGGNGGNDRGGITSESRNGLDVGLDTSSSRGVTSSNGQYDGWGFHNWIIWVLRVNKSMMSNRPRRGSP